MDWLANIFDWALRIAGLFSLTIAVFNLFSKDFEWIENIEIISQPSENDFDRCLALREYTLGQSNGERTLFLPTTCAVKSFKMCSVLLTESGNIRKSEVIQEVKGIVPFEGLLINVFRNCGAPNYLIEWTVNFGGKALYYFTENGFNGNNNRTIIKYSYGFLSKIRRLLNIK